MSPPIREGSGSSIGSIRLGDGTEISEVRTGAGDVLFSGSAIFDSGVARFEFEQDVADSWGNNDGTNNGVSFTTGAQVGDYALSLDGADDYVSDIPVNVNGWSEATLACWVYADANSDSRFFGQTSNGFNDVFFLRQEGGEWRGYVDSSEGTSGDLVSGVSIDTAQWTHIVLAYDGSEARVYVDGVREAADTGYSGTISQSDGGVVSIGARNDGSTFFDGRIDDARIYDKGLSDFEVSNLYNMGTI